MSKSSQGSRATVYARYTNRDDRDENDNIHKAVKSLETSILASKHERRSTVSVWVLGVQESVVGGADQQANEGKAEDVEPVLLLSDWCLFSTS